MMARCRECDTKIMFVRIETTGRAMPVDPFPDPDGNVYARHTTTPGGLLGHVTKHDEPLPEGWRIYMPHFASCPMRPKGEPAPAEFEPPPYADPEPTLFDQPTEGNPL
jgi:hypothetical protein